MKKITGTMSVAALGGPEPPGAPWRLATLLRRGALLLAFGAVVLVVALAIVRQRRIDQLEPLLVGRDPCVVESLTRAQRRLASGQQVKRIHDLRQACKVRRSRLERLHRLRAAAAERQQRARRAAVEQAERCGAIARELTSGVAGRSVEGQRLAPALGRIARRELEPADLTLDWSGFECRAGAPGVAVGAALCRAAFDAAARWLETTVPSRSASDLMARGVDTLDQQHSLAFGNKVEMLAREATSGRGGARIEHAAELCRFTARLGLATGPACAAAGR